MKNEEEDIVMNVDAGEQKNQTESKVVLTVKFDESQNDNYLKTMELLS